MISTFSLVQLPLLIIFSLLCNPVFYFFSCYIMSVVYFVLLACQAGSYGENCLLTCDCSGAPCDPITGQCICPDGKMGHSCQEGIHYCNVL